MFAKTIIDSDAFLDMPSSSQLLYFHMSMRADDDGFVNKPKSIMRAIGAKDDDANILIAKKFIIPFESGVVVIKHWKIHNFIAKDRYNETKYLDEKATLSVDGNKAYTTLNSSMSTDCIQPVNGMDTQVRLGKVRIDKTSTDACVVPSYPEDFTSFWNAYPNRKAKGAAYTAWKKFCKESNFLQNILLAIEKQKRSEQWLKDGGRFVPYPATWLNARRWEDEDGACAGKAKPVKYKTVELDGEWVDVLDE